MLSSDEIQKGIEGLMYKNGFWRLPDNKLLTTYDEETLITEDEVNKLEKIFDILMGNGVTCEISCLPEDVTYSKGIWHLEITKKSYDLNLDHLVDFQTLYLRVYNFSINYDPS